MKESLEKFATFRETICDANDEEDEESSSEESSEEVEKEKREAEEDERAAPESVGNVFDQDLKNWLEEDKVTTIDFVWLFKLTTYNLIQS
jgi:hypothetical protein